ncbi:GDSL-like Lipase/Acylhydrolase family protein [Arthrobacter subterraneus]|uniref:GDSL-like Lipase/Acylhydrolase family protein n=1 Tax=Arthrobacter subterraneus TaxID=335973 RepID=A0A1G8D4M0_9MICC|nr:SGNH/GDSL hydrolase family protein [Arthrobacter subterraneus]SDH52160.1 GDSL-like Lipase/Acylhydrolase family protein [Arthrobacter subterraneus]
MNLLRMTAGALMTVGLIVPASASVAAPPVPLDYVAVGDSYAAGFGAGSYVNGCGQSPLGLPGLLDARKQIQLTFSAACSGARAANIPGGEPDVPDIPDVPEQVVGLAGTGVLGPQTDLVTVAAGGNDVDFGRIVGVCATQPIEVCQEAVDFAVFQARTTVAGDLDALYAQLDSAAPNAQIIVTGYPHLFSPEFGNAPLLSLEAQELFNAGTDALNDVIEDRAEAAGFDFVDVAKRFDKHGIGSPEPWIIFTGFTAIDDLHPTAKGYQSGYLPEVRKAID